MRQSFFAAGVGLFVFAATGAAQQRPDFTGTWVMDMTRSESPAQQADASPKKPVTLVIVHRPAELSIDSESDGHKDAVTYRLDERDARSQAIGTSGDTVESALMRWDGAKLVTTTVYRVSGMAVKKTDTHRLSADGTEMTVETELQVQHGYESNGRGPAAYNNAKDVYRKSPK